MSPLFDASRSSATAPAVTGDGGGSGDKGGTGTDSATDSTVDNKVGDVSTYFFSSSNNAAFLVVR